MIVIEMPTKAIATIGVHGTPNKYHLFKQTPYNYHKTVCGRMLTNNAWSLRIKDVTELSANEMCQACLFGLDYSEQE